MDLKNKVVVVTGASAGIGRAIAQNLAAKGAKLSLIARRMETLQQTADLITSDNTDVLCVKADVTDREAVDKAIAATIERFARIDVIINNAGIGYYGPVHTIPTEEFDRMVRTNVYGCVNMVQAAFPYLRQYSGMVVNISSTLSKRSIPFYTAYGSTKSMLDALSDGMRLELKKFGIKVVSYCPPVVDTDFYDIAQKDDSVVMQKGNGKIPSAGDVAERIVKAIIREKREVVQGNFMGVLHFFAPKMVDNMLYKIMVQKLYK